MATSVYASTTETTNLNRASRVMLGPCTDQFRDVLRKRIMPANFSHVVRQNRFNLRRLTKPQSDLIFPTNGSYNSDYSDMDISLMYTLLRNVCNIQPHSNGWGNDPDPGDMSLSANIERIVMIRNYLGHLQSPHLPQIDFEVVWSMMRLTVEDIDAFLDNGYKYVEDVDFLLYEVMDPDIQRQYIDILKKQVEEGEQIKQMLIQTNQNLSHVQDEVKKIGEPIPPNIKKLISIELSRWKEEDIFYHETHGFLAMVEKVNQQPCVTFVGIPGSGKSATAHHIALKLQQEEGYEVVPIRKIKHRWKYCDPDNPQVFVIDDFVGVHETLSHKMHSLMDYSSCVFKPVMSRSKTLMTCRESVFNEKLASDKHFGKKDHIIKLHDSDFALDETDKVKIFRKYHLKSELLSSCNLASTSRMFPLLCKLFLKDKIRSLGVAFFTHPVPCILEQLNDMKEHNIIQYAALVLCMFNGNELSREDLKSTKCKRFMEMRSVVLETCELQSSTEPFQFERALKNMIGTYTKQNESSYSFLHDSLFEMCAYHYGKDNLHQILHYMSSRYVSDFIKLEEEYLYKREWAIDIDICTIRLRPEHYQLLAERLIRDIQNTRIDEVFINTAINHPVICQEVVTLISQKANEVDMKETFHKLLCCSCEEGFDNVVSELTIAGADTNKQCVFTDRTPLTIACLFGHLNVVELLLKSNADINLQDGSGYTPLIVACNVGHVNMVEMLLRNNADINLQDRFRDTPLLVACNQGHVNVVKVLLRNSAHINLQDESGYSPLMDACGLGHVNVVEVLLRNNADINLQDGSGDTPLTVACSKGHVNVVVVLLKNKADINLKDGYGLTPLMAACSQGHMNVVEVLLKNKADINLEDGSGYTPLIDACNEGHVNMVEMLLRNNADINLQDRFGDTPLTVACIQGHVNVVEMLLKNNADINLQDGSGDTPLVNACSQGHVNVIEMLLKKNADKNLEDGLDHTAFIAACSQGHVNVVEMLLKNIADINLQDGSGDTPLTAACSQGHVNVVEVLLKNNADINLKDRSGLTPLIAAGSQGHLNVVEVLLKNYADINLQDGIGYTPMTHTCNMGHVNVVEMLLRNNADINLRDGFGDTPLIVACSQGHVNVVEVLLRNNADTNLQNGSGDTPLIVACSKGHVNVVEVLLKNNADINLQGGSGLTPLTVACSKKRVNMVKVLLKHNANINLQDGCGNTPLTVACCEGHVNGVKVLLKNNADINLQNGSGFTPLTVARSKERVNVVEVLRKNNADINQQDGSDLTPLRVACSKKRKRSPSRPRGKVNSKKRKHTDVNTE